ncbi:putative RNA methyltransferase [Salinimonas sediminis]|uniref:Methyltransferase domain-containing protein n=1 Tax=Salinimonas sediminis TaxID=2303538 RepID=A0A346NLW3_9ALTE|nr:methyltransferase domain-containing protein [Salinimonas sediminis]AXR06520.1 methyltransferase domain-containing protein [Salinimonas sediminis]
MWQCPLCQHPLTTSGTTWQCDNRHSFDQAKSGYVNLLPVQNKKSRHPGDDKAMLQARRAFHLAQGYMPLMQHLGACVVKHLPAGLTPVQLYDAGCGEGSYVAFIATYLQQAGVPVTAAGSDIAKAGVEMAARRYPQADFVVASSFALPVADASLDVVLQVFAPGSEQEYRRILSSEGILVTVDPGPAHLSELKAKVYDNPQQHSAPSMLPAPWQLVEESALGFTVDLSDVSICSALLGMTPYVWKLSEHKRAEMGRMLTSVTADFVVRVWRVDTSE